MLQHTFIHIQGIGGKTEQKLWHRGILTWWDFLEKREVVFSPARDRFIEKELEISIQNHDNIRFFQARLASGEMWRLFKPFKDRCVYLDIETAWDDQGAGEITLIGLFDGRSVQTFVNGINLDEFESAIAQYELLITFNGTCFDLPLILRWFGSISLPPAHIDLRFLLKKLGYTGGLKNIELEFGIERDKEISGIDGRDAVMLWKAYQEGEKAALEKLISYNTADIVNLLPLMTNAYLDMMKRLIDQ